MVGANETSYDTWEQQLSGTGAAWDSEYDTNPSLARWIVTQGLTTWGGNPYEGVSAYDSSSYLADIDAKLATLGSIVTQLGVASGFGSYSDQAEGTLPAEVTAESLDTLRKRIQAEAGNLGSQVILDAANAAYQASLDGVLSAAATAFRTRAEARHDASEALLETRLADAGAANSSAYAFALAGMLSDFEDQVNAYDAERSLGVMTAAMQSYVEVFLNVVKADLVSHAEERRLHAQHTLEGTRLLLSALSDEATQYHNVFEAQKEAAAVGIGAKSEEYQANLEIDTREVLWDPELFARMGNLVSNWSGGAIPLTQGPSRTQTAVAGAMMGAAGGAKLGASIGAAGGPIGATGGAVIGGLAGLIAGAAG